MTDVQYKTAVNTRASLASRLPKKKAEAVPTNASLHQKAETTYDTAFAGASAGQDSQGLTEDCSRSSPADGVASSAVGSGADTQQQDEAQRRGYKVLHYSSSEWESASHAASRNVQPVQQLDFYSTARKVEQADDDARGGLVGSVQRTLDIRTKRAEDAALRPAAPFYLNTRPRVAPSIAAEERHGAKHNYLDLVDCTQLKPQTEEQISYTDAPLTRLPGETLSQDLKVQSKIISEMGTSREFFRGTPKFLSDTPVGYAGHVPMTDRNVAFIHHGDDAQRLFAKSYMTLAEHGGGVAPPPCGSAVLSLPRRGGSNRPAPKTLPPKSTEAINQTAEGRMQQMALYGTLERERQMNVRNDAQNQNYF